MAKPLLSSNNMFLSNEDAMIANLITRINELVQEITKLSDISNETLQNNFIWRNKYEKLKDLYLKNINDELTLEDLITGKIAADTLKFELPNKLVISPKNISTEQGKKLNDLIILNKDLENKLMSGQEQLNQLKNQFNQLEINGTSNNDNDVLTQKIMEKKYQAKIAEIEEEIKRIKESNREKQKSEQNFENLSNDFNKLKEEKKKMEHFYQKKIKDLEEQDKSKRKKKGSQGLFEQNLPLISQINSPKNILNGTTNQIIVEPNLTGNNINIIGTNISTADNRLSPSNRGGITELETIKEIRTNERIEEGYREEGQFSEKKPPKIMEVVMEEKKSNAAEKRSSTKKPIGTKDLRKETTKKKIPIKK